MLRKPAAPPDGAGRRFTGRHVAALQFLVSASALLLVVATLGLVALHKVAKDEALRDATRTTRAIVRTIVEPRVDRGLTTGDPAAVSRLDGVLANGVVGDLVIRVKVWLPDGTVAWSDEKRLIGFRDTPSPNLVAAARTGEVRAQMSDLDEAENRFERGAGPLLEVYVPMTAEDGTRFVAEAYYPTSGLAAASDAIWRSFLPVLLAALAALALAQVPLAWWYGRRGRAEALERVELMERAEAVRRDERSRIAADLHDSVVQDLAGVAFDLSASAHQVRSRPSDELEQSFRHAAEVCRASIEHLRTLLVQLHPEDPPAIDLGQALPELAADLKGRGVKVDLAVEALAAGQEVRALLYRAAQEGVRNVARHAAATRATISLTERDGVATLLIEDDGQGMTSRDLVRQRANGHVGLTLLADRVRSSQGELTISSEPGRGTRLTVWLPVGTARGA